MAGVINSFGYLGFIAVKALVAWLLVANEGRDEVAVVNVITCAAGVVNLTGGL